MKCPSQTLKDVGNSHEGKELTAGEPLDFLKEEEEEEEEEVLGAAQAVLAPSGAPTQPHLGRLWHGLA